MTSPSDIPLFNVKHLGLNDPPFLGSVAPVYTPGDRPEVLPQETPFFNSQQFRLWNDNELQAYNKLVDVLVKWRDRGWCEFTEVSEWVDSKENWTSWIKYYALLQVPAEDMHMYLYEMNILRINPSDIAAQKERSNEPSIQSSH